MLRTCLIGSLVACVLGCESEPLPAARAAVVPIAKTEAAAAPEYPEPPPLTGDASRCVTRRFQRGSSAWDVDTYEYDAAQRILGRSLHFDTEGRLTRWDMSETFRTHAYDAQGNLSEVATWKNDKLVEGTRWSNRYEGDPLRIAATDLSDFREAKQRNRPSMRIRYTYDSDGLVDTVTREWQRGTEVHDYTWQGDRIVTVRSSLGSRHPSSTVPYHESRAYAYDQRGRLKVFTVDGELPLGEGATADGKPDHIRTFSYDASGRLERMESDGRGGDVAPEAPDGKPDEIMLFSPPCDPIVKLAPQLFRFPELHLPRSIEPPLR